MSLVTPNTIRTLQRKLYAKAKQEPAFRFYALYDKVCRADILGHAYGLVRSNRGAPGIDGVTFEDIEAGIGTDAYLAQLQEELERKTYRADGVRRVWIPKPDGSKRPLGIPTIRDRIVQMALKLVVEPIFEADFCDHSYGFRPKRSAHDAVKAVTDGLFQGKTQVIDADLSKYLDRCSYYPPADSSSSKRSGRVSGSCIFNPLRLPCETWMALSSPRLTRCNTV